jgi:hypothetical protein
MPDWPEGTERALTFSLLSVSAASGGAGRSLEDDAGVESWLDSIRQADAFTFEVDGD